MMRSCSRTPLRVRWTCLASSVVTTSLVIMSILMPSSSRRGVMASTIAVLPDPTGPPMPTRVIFFAIRCSNQWSIHEQAHVRLVMDRREDVRQRRIARHVRQARRGGVFIASVRESVDLVEDLLRLDVADLHQPQGRA